MSDGLENAIVVTSNLDEKVGTLTVSAIAKFESKAAVVEFDTAKSDGGEGAKILYEEAVRRCREAIVKMILKLASVTMDRRNNQGFRLGDFHLDTYMNPDHPKDKRPILVIHPEQYSDFMNAVVEANQAMIKLEEKAQK